VPAPFRSHGAKPYAIGLAGVVVATILRFLFDPVLGEHLSFSFHYLAVSLAAWTGGFWPAVITAVCSALVGNFFFTDPYHSLEISSNEELVSLIFFILVSVIIGILSEISLNALARAKKAEQEKDNFMAILAHELRSPLSVIYYANSLNRLSAAQQPGQQLDVIDREVQHLNVMIEDLLDVSRAARGKIRLTREHVDASEVMQAAIDKVRPLIASHKHTLNVDVAPTPMPLFVDPARMEQVLANLLTNAAKYTPDGGKIDVRADSCNGSVTFSIRDNGIGITEQMLPRVFDLFVQGDAGSGRDEGGLGIGLALARKISEMHGGTIRAISAGPNRGSEFVVTVPLEKAVAERSALASA
jgi:signal transduction histidine kinase